MGLLTQFPLVDKRCLIKVPFYLNFALHVSECNSKNVEEWMRNFGSHDDVR